MVEKRNKEIKVLFKPKLIKDIEVFLGFANFYWRFIQGLSKLTTLLTLIPKITSTANSRVPLKLADNSNFLTPDGKLAFSQLRQSLTKTPIPHYFDLKPHIWIKTNTSGYAIGNIFCQ